MGRCADGQRKVSEMFQGLPDTPSASQHAFEVIPHTADVLQLPGGLIRVRPPLWDRSDQGLKQEGMSLSGL